MGQDISYNIEHLDRKSGEWECYGSPLEGWRNYEVFEKLKSKWTPGLPANASFESSHRFSKTYKDEFSGKDEPVYNCGVGYISYKRWLKCTKFKDIYHDKKHWDDYRVVFGLDW